MKIKTRESRRSRKFRLAERCHDCGRAPRDQADFEPWLYSLIGDEPFTALVSTCPECVEQKSRQRQAAAL